MRRVLVMTFVVMMAAFASMAQTQTGYVKTKGRLNAEGKVVAGKRIPEAMIQAKGCNAARSNSNGVFSIPIPSSKFQLQSVKKNGYMLLDPEILLKAYSHSSNPLIIVMVPPDQKMDDKLAAERELRRSLEKRLHSKEDALELLRKQNKVTQEEYRKTLEALYQEQDKNGQLISEMAEHYANVDYDQLDAFNQQVNAFILSGELVKADSMLRSKGDMDSRIARIQEQEAAQANEKAEIAQRQANLDRSIAGTKAEIADVGLDCYNFFRKFVIECQHDSAAMYIEKRANIDQQNIQWQFDASRYFQNRGETTKAVHYNQRALELARALAQTDPQAHEATLAMTLNNAAMLYEGQGRKDEAINMYNEALAIFRRLATTDTLTYNKYVASTLNNLARTSRNLDKSEALFTEALDIYWRYAFDDAATYIPRVASVMNNLGLLYADHQYATESEEMFQNALGIYRRLAETKPATYLPDVASTLNNMSAMYHHFGIKAAECNQMQQEAIRIYNDLAYEDPQRYYPKQSVILINLVKKYYDTGRNEEGEKACDEALDTYRWLANEKPFIYKSQLAKLLFEQAVRLYQDGKLDKSEQLFTEALGFYRELAETSPTYLPEEAKLLRNIANLLDKRQHWADSEKMYQEELVINKQLAKDNPATYRADVARSWGNLSNHALLMKQFDKAEEYALEGLACDSSKLFIRANLAAALLFKGEYSQAEAIYNQYRGVLKSTFLDDLDQFGRLGIIPAEREADVEKIRQMLQQQ